MFQVFYNDEDTIEDLKRKIDFLMSFRDFAELSFFFVPPGITFCALSFLKGSNSSSSSISRQSSIIRHQSSVVNHQSSITSPQLFRHRKTHLQNIKKKERKKLSLEAREKRIAPQSL